MKKIKNKALLEAEICGKHHVIESNETVVEPIKIKFEKFAPCKFCFGDEPFKYDIKIKNESEVNLIGLVFKDGLDEDTDYVKDSFKVNGHHHHVHVKENTIEYPICELKGGEELFISFEVKLKDKDYNKKDKEEHKHCRVY